MALAATLFFVSVLVFVVVRVLPGDPAIIILGTEGSPEAVARLRPAMGLDRPIAVQYVEWIGRAVRGDLGRSIQYDVPVAGLILSRMSVTLPLTLLAAGLMVATAVPVGVFAATRHRRWGDYLAMTLSQLGIAVPGVLGRAAPGPALLREARLGAVGRVRRLGQGFWPALRSLILPAFALGFFQFAVLARTTRSAVLEVLREEYVRTARAKGVAEGGVLFRHALRNAMIPVVTVAGIQLGQLMAGSIVLETVFYLPGLGRLALGAISARDLPVVQGVVLFVASMIVLINVVVDVLYGFLDPRIRYE